MDESSKARRRHGHRVVSSLGYDEKLIEGNTTEHVMTSDLDRPIKCGGCACFLVSLIFVGAIIGIVIAAVALGFGSASTQTTVYKQSGLLMNSPYGQTLDGSNSPLAMQLPNNLAEGGFIDITYCATSQDAAAHTITFEVGSLATRFDGPFTTATFDGNIGSTICYRPVLNNRVHVVSTFGVTLS